MGKKNIKPSLNQPVIRQNVAKPALEGLTEENLTATTGVVVGVGASITIFNIVTGTCCSYDGDDAE